MARNIPVRNLGFCPGDCFSSWIGLVRYWKLVVFLFLSLSVCLSACLFLSLCLFFSHTACYIHIQISAIIYSLTWEFKIWVCVSERKEEEEWAHELASAYCVLCVRLRGFERDACRLLGIAEQCFVITQTQHISTSTEQHDLGLSLRQTLWGSLSWF